MKDMYILGIESSCDEMTVAISSVPFFTIDALVSSQLLSIPNIYVSFI